MIVVQVLREFAVDDFFSYKSRKRRIFFYRRATYKDTYVEAVESAKEGGSRKGKVPCAPDQEFLFWFTSIWVLRDPARLMYRLLRNLVYEEAMCEGNSGNGLPYAARAVP